MPHCQQVIAVGLVLGQTDHFAVAELAQQRDVSFANRAPQIAGPRQRLSLLQQISRGLIRFEPLAQNDAHLALRLLTAASPEKARQKLPDQESNQRYRNRDYDDLGNARYRAPGARRQWLGFRKQLA